mmetsp:Transcript_21026/g.33919  ORF Transcript_21026/g.33919 Transcript_21026/m.33919 type:complete len:85 (+) Transcript_21026:797-1051(+)
MCGNISCIMRRPTNSSSSCCSNEQQRSYFREVHQHSILCSCKMSSSTQVVTTCSKQLKTMKLALMMVMPAQLDRMTSYLSRLQV